MEVLFWGLSLASIAAFDFFGDRFFCWLVFALAMLVRLRRLLTDFMAGGGGEEEERVGERGVGGVFIWFVRTEEQQPELEMEF